MDFIGEEWRPVAGFDGYEVSSLGRVRSWRGQAGTRRSTPRLRALCVDKDGYHKVGLENHERRQVMFFVHNLVLEAFKGPRPEGMQCRHMDGSKTNNVPANLEWGTPLENSRDKRVHGTQCRGRQIYLAKCDEEMVRAIRVADGGIKDIARRFGISVANVYKIRSRQLWSWVD